MSKELIKAARSYIGSGAIYHQREVGDCFSAPSEKCLQIGLGPVFDCSGFIIASLCKVAGRQIGDWPASLRHVRDMWQASQDGELLMRTTITEGSILVTSRRYDLHGEEVRVPGHIGIVTYAQPDEVHYVHASAEAGAVEERPLRTLDTILGAITLKDPENFNIQYADA